MWRVGNFALLVVFAGGIAGCATGSRTSRAVASTSPNATSVNACETDEATVSQQPSLQIQPVTLEEPFSSNEQASLNAVSVLPAVIEESTASIDLATALASVDGSHPVVGVARWRTQEALARLDAANVLWLPTLQAGVSYHRLDGNLQASDGTILDVNRSSLQSGLGAGAVGAGQTVQPGLVALFHLADAKYQPRIAERLAWAEGHAATAARHDQLLAAGLAHQQLLAAQQRLALVEDNHHRVAELAELTSNFAEAGEGLQSDADRLATELQLALAGIDIAQEQVVAASAQLSQAISATPGTELLCAEPVMAPIDLIGPDEAAGGLVSVGLRNRPELKEAQCLVAAACEQLKREQKAPLLPSVLLGVSYGGFGGGLGDTVDRFNDRAEFNAAAVWQLRNLGFGESAVRRERQATLQRSKFEQVRRMDEVAREVLEAQGQVVTRASRIKSTEAAISTAAVSYDRNLARIRQGQGLPIEVLQSAAALDTARRAYLDAVLAYNSSQLSLYRALGWPVQM